MKKDNVELRLPAKQISTIEKIAKLAGVKPAVVVSVMLATYLVYTEEKAK